MHVAQRLELFLDAYRRPGGGRWTGQKLDEATGGVVTRSYFTNIRKGRIENPGYEKMRAIARAMGFPPALRFEDALGDGALAARVEGQDLAGRVGHLFKTILHPGTGERYTNAEVARMSAGGLTEGEVEGIRTGKIPDPRDADGRSGVGFLAPGASAKCDRPNFALSTSLEVRMARVQRP